MDTNLKRLDEVQDDPEEREVPPWAYQSPCYQALNLRFGVRCSYLDAGAYLDHVLSGLRADQEEPQVWYSLGQSDVEPERPYSLSFGSELIALAHSKSFAIGTLLWHLNAATVDRADPFVVLHAGGVVLEDTGVIISGPSGAGKTTLTAALVRAGFSYLTDEALAIDPATGLLQPYPKALTIQPGSWDLLADLRPPPSDFSRRVWHVAPKDIRPNAIAAATPPAVVLFITRKGPAEGGAVPGIEEVSRSEAALELARQSFGLSSSMTPTMRVLADILARSRCFRVSTTDLDRAVSDVRDLMRRAVA